MRAAHRLGSERPPQYIDRFARHDLTLPQGFAYRVTREHQAKSNRGVEAAPRAVEGWATRPERPAAIGLDHAPDQNTPWHAFGVRAKPGVVNSTLALTLRVRATGRRSSPGRAGSRCT